LPKQGQQQSERPEEFSVAWAFCGSGNAGTHGWCWVVGGGVVGRKQPRARRFMIIDRSVKTA
jgi:hypothetical protein